ncbi:hypothetical protein HPB50_006866 [Hyalomma asiaticum]|uniref:Uncharacterized protein n=1 Tax=Hyalomma asiaticum TaxID=266040 RepID=A0ACB7RKU1_HYAAI|nr:hypothetical protein HPB50_006866 [Hyalomma asiaticum]
MGEEQAASLPFDPNLAPPFAPSDISDAGSPAIQATTAVASAPMQPVAAGPPNGHAADTIGAEGAPGGSSVRRRSSRHRPHKGAKRHHDKHHLSDTEHSPSQRPQQPLTSSDGVQRATSGSTLMTSPSSSTEKTSSPPPDHEEAVADLPRVAALAVDEDSLIVSGSRHRPQTGTTHTGLLKYWPLAVAVGVLGLMITLQLLFATPPRMQGAPQAHSSDHACESEQCRHYAQLFARSMNLSAPACDNFYEHVCGKWEASHSKENKLSALADSWRRLSKRAASRLRMVQSPVGKPEPVHRVSHFIYTCVDIIKVPKAPEVKEVLENGNITWPKRNERPDFLGALFYMARRVFVPVVFDVATMQADQREPSQPKAQTLFFGLPSRFMSHCRALARLRRSGRLLEHLRLTYEVLDGKVNETRLEELATQFDYLDDFFRRYERASYHVTRRANASFLLRYTPSVPKDRWNSLTKRYLNVSLIDETDGHESEVVIQAIDVFPVIFEVHAKQGEHVTDDIVGSLCAQALVDYMSSDVLTSLLGGNRELATESIYERCFSDAYRFYDTAIIAYFHNPLSREVADLRRVVTQVRETFSGVILHGNSKLRAVTPNTTKRNSSVPSGNTVNFDLALAGLDILNATGLINSYDHYPQGVDSSLQDWMRHAAFASSGGKSPTGAPLRESLNENFGRAAGRFLNFRLGLAHMEDPFYMANVSAAVLMAGVGARMAATLFYDHVKERSVVDVLNLYTEIRNASFLKSEADKRTRRFRAPSPRST